MQTDNRFLDDFARVAASVVGTLQNVRGDVSTRLRQQFERILANMDLVTREEFEAVKAMAAVARAENEALAARLEALEGGSARTPEGRGRQARCRRRAAVQGCRRQAGAPGQEEESGQEGAGASWHPQASNAGPEASLSRPAGPPTRCLGRSPPQKGGCASALSLARYIL